MGAPCKGASEKQESGLIEPSADSTDEGILYEYFATCPKGFERLLANELKFQLKVLRVRPLKGGVVFFGNKVQGYKVCLWSRLASRVTRVLERIDAHDADALYEGVRALKWETYIAPGSTIAVSARGTNKALRNTQFVALKVKDAICDRLRVMNGERPDVCAHRPDVPIWVSIHGNKATISLDYAGESLHRRGYRAQGQSVEAPLKEALAAAMLEWGGWRRLACGSSKRQGQTCTQGDCSNSEMAMSAQNQARTQGAFNNFKMTNSASVKGEAYDARRLYSKQDTAPNPESRPDEQGSKSKSQIPVFVDPVCGSGTLIFEAVMIATDRAPGLSRDYWGFEGCADFDAESFEDLLAEADERFEAGLEHIPTFIGADIDPSAIEIAKENAKRLGLSQYLHFVQADCADLTQTLKQFSVFPDSKGFIAMNPPYGVRLLSGGGLDVFYEKLKQGLRPLTENWTMVAITPDKTFDSSLGFDVCDSLAVFNGSLEASIRRYTLGSSFMEEASFVSLGGKEVTVEVSSDHALQFAHRLRKMAKARRKWAKKNDISAYRVYDADLPDYAVAVDCFYEDETNNLFLLITEYQAPKEIDPQKALRRFKDACAVAEAMFEIPHDQLFTRVRKQAKGGSQYFKDEHSSSQIIVREQGHPFELDLSGYLDTGLFLDHRITRALVGKMAQGKRFLNLFAYTGTASVYAGCAGALSTTTVDMSQTYLDWAKRNMQRAGLKGTSHVFVRADVLTWIKKAQANDDRYDLVFLDPPTFSNSKTMGDRTWDIQRDYLELLKDVSVLLEREGVIVFSGNLRSFKLDVEAVESLGLEVKDITAETIPEDFSRNPKIHFCYVLSKGL